MTFQHFLLAASFSSGQHALDQTLVLTHCIIIPHTHTPFCAGASTHFFMLPHHTEDHNRKVGFPRVQFEVEILIKDCKNGNAPSASSSSTLRKAIQDQQDLYFYSLLVTEPERNFRSVLEQIALICRKAAPCKMSFCKMLEKFCRLK